MTTSHEVVFILDDCLRGIKAVQKELTAMNYKALRLSQLSMGRGISDSELAFMALRLRRQTGINHIILTCDSNFVGYHGLRANTGSVWRIIFWPPDKHVVMAGLRVLKNIIPSKFVELALLGRPPYVVITLRRFQHETVARLKRYDADVEDHLVLV